MRQAPLLAACVVLMGAGLLPLALPSTEASDYVLHGPITISTNAGFTAANGVTGGSGTPQDPHVISGWEIAAAGPDNLYIRDTDAHVVLRHLYVHSESPVTNAIVLINVSNAVLEDVRASASRYGLFAAASNLVVRNGTFDSNAYDGIAITRLTVSSGDVRIENNTVRNNRHGVQIVDSSNVAVLGNNVSANGYGASEPSGIIVRDSARVRIEGNTVTSNALGGISVLTSTDLFASSNEVSGSIEGISLEGVPNALVSGNVLASNDYGIRLIASPGARVESNDMTMTRVGLLLAGSALGFSDNVGVANNSFETSERGVWMSYARNATFLGNAWTIAGVFLDGSALEHFRTHQLGTDNTVNGKPIHYHADCSALVLDGIPAGQVILVNCQDVRLTHLDVTDTEAAVFLAFSSQVNVTGNTFARNFVAIRLRDSSGVLVARNNFLDNVAGAQSEGGAGNRWDEGYPRGGNYWSDYVGVDRCSGALQDHCEHPDGLGDAPQAIEGVGADQYPRMERYLTAPAAPVAAFTVSPVASGTVVVDAGPSTDAQDPDAAVEVRWDWDGDGEWDTGWSSAKVASHSFDRPGTYTIRLEVRDTDGLTGIATQVVEIQTRLDPFVLGAVAVGAAATAAGVAVFWYRRRRRAHRPRE